MIVECVFCEELYETDWPCWTCRQFHCKECSCRRLKFAEDVLVFKPLFYAPKTFRAVTLENEVREGEVAVEEVSPKKRNPALWGAGFSSLFLGALWYWSTVMANSAPSTSIVPQFITKYEKGFQGFDFLLHRLFPQTLGQKVVPALGIPEVLYDSLKVTAIERIPTTFDLVKMVAKPTPMPFTTVWSSAAEFMRTLRLTAFLGLAKEDAIKRALSDSLLFPTVDSEKAARMLTSMRSTLVKRGAAGLLGGFTIGFVPGLVIPGYAVAAGCLLPYNVAAIFNSYSQTVSVIEQKAMAVTPESAAKLVKHVDAFWMKQATKIKVGGTAGIVTAVLGYGYMQYKGFRNLLGYDK